MVRIAGFLFEWFWMGLLGDVFLLGGMFVGMGLLSTGFSSRCVKLGRARRGGGLVF